MATVTLAIDPDVFELDSLFDLAGLYNVKVVNSEEGYIDVEGEDTDIDQFAEFIAQSQL